MKTTCVFISLFLFIILYEGEAVSGSASTHFISNEECLLIPDTISFYNHINFRKYVNKKFITFNEYLIKQIGIENITRYSCETEFGKYLVGVSVYLESKETIYIQFKNKVAISHLERDECFKDKAISSVLEKQRISRFIFYGVSESTEEIIFE